MRVIVWKSCFLFWIKVGVQYSQTEDSVTVLGVSKHSKDAAEGVNAIVGLAESLSLINPIQPFSLLQMLLVRMQQEKRSLACNFR